MKGRSRTRGGSRRPLGVALVVAAALVAYGVAPQAAFDTGGVDRSTGVDVVLDESGVHALETASSVHVNATEPLVNVTNRLGREVTVTVALREGSTGKGDLVVDGTSRGDSASFVLASGAEQTVEIAVPDDGSLAGETVYFDVKASDAGLSVSANNRSVPITT